VTMPAVSVRRGSASARDLALASADGPGPVAHFLHVVAPEEVRGALQHCLPAEVGVAGVQLVRAKLKPGRKLVAEYAVALPTGARRRVSATWAAPGAVAPGPAPDEDAEARRRGVLAPFHRAWIGWDDGRSTVSVAPVDAAFPQLVRLHDPRHLGDVLRTTPGLTQSADGAAGEITVETVRYRPGQRHVLRVRAGKEGTAFFVKVYRDDTGRHTVAAAARVAGVLAAGGGTGGASASAGVYVAADRTALWAEVPGVSLGDVVAASGAAAARHVGSVGSALRRLHDATPVEDLPDRPDAAQQADETLRTAQLVDALLPPVGERLRLAVARALDLLSALPPGPRTLTHGDVKCDNLLVEGARVHLLDFDRVGRGDPAADLGKFLADLRWCAGADERVVGALHEALLHGYGAVPWARLARARAYEGLLHLRMAARRVPIHDPDWAARVTQAVQFAAERLPEGSAPWPS
jgi:aminoglycoside phosphotransferase (APT) family kinase protein